VKFEIGVMAKLDQLSFEHLAGLSYRFYTSAFTGSLVNQSNRLARSFERLYDVLAFDILTLFLKVGFTSTILFAIQPVIALALLAFFALYAAAAVGLALWKMPASAAAAAASSRQTGQLADKLTNISAIKYFAREPDEITSYRQTVATTKQAFTRDWVTQEIINAVQAVLLIAFSAGFFIGSLYLVSQGRINFGQFILVQSYVMVIFDALWGIGRIARNIERSLADAAEMTTIMSTPAEVQDRPDAAAVTISTGRVDFERVTFGYDGQKRHRVFQGLDLHIEPGEKIGLVGTSGGGKTTITKLLLRLLDIQDGSILIDGHDIAKLRQADVRRAISYVPQEPLLFHRSLQENIAYGRPEATVRQINQT
jgi:ATP-binding cassette subfamily B protein